MTMLDDAARKTDQADLVILSHVETLRDQREPVTAASPAALIGGAPVREMQRRMTRLAQLGLLEVEPGLTPFYWLSAFGAELLRRELIGWTPSEREEQRRDREMILVASNPRRLR
jgi:hypothetical protein